MDEPEIAIPAARHERSDIGERFIWAALAASGGLLLACALLTYGFYPSSHLDRTLPLPLPRYPAPRLQPDPPADLRAFYAEEMRRLASSGWADSSHRTAHIPIEQAMREVARDGIPGWPRENPP